VRARCCYVHIGTHKTGTTSLQDTLTRNAELFAEAGLLVARTGRPVALAGSSFVGNQNLAWEMESDRRYDASFGTLRDFEYELSNSSCAEALVTSEDFCLAFDRPERLDELRDACMRAGYVPKIVVYLREQATYAQSLYTMFVLNGGLPIGFEQFCDYIFAIGEIGWANNRFPFEYDVLLKPFTRCFGRENVIVRAYRSALASQWLAHDFISLLETSRTIALRRLIVSPRVNEAGSLLNVMEALHGNLRTTRGEMKHPLRIATETSVPQELLHRKFVAIGPREADRFHDRFDESNAGIAEQFGIEIERIELVDTADRHAQRAYIRACMEEWRVR